MSDDAELEAYVDAAAALLGLAIPAEWRASVVTNFRATLRHAERVLDFPLPDPTEPAPVFEA